MDYRPNEFVNAFMLQSFAHPKGAKKAIGNEMVTDFINVAVQRLARDNAVFIGEHKLRAMLVEMVNEMDLEDDFPAEGLDISIEDIIPPEHRTLFELQMLEHDDPENPDDPLFPWDGFKQVLHDAHRRLHMFVVKADHYDYQVVHHESDTKLALQRVRLIRLLVKEA